MVLTKITVIGETWPDSSIRSRICRKFVHCMQEIVFLLFITHFCEFRLRDTPACMHACIYVSMYVCINIHMYIVYLEDVQAVNHLLLNVCAYERMYACVLCV